MGSGDHKHHHHHLNFYVQVHLPHIHFHHHHHHDQHYHGIKELMGIPKGCLPVLVGHDGEEQKKFIIPVIYINHPLFTQLLKGTELEECELHHDGPINIHCHVEEFRYVEGMIDKETHATSHNNHHTWCYKA